MPGVLCLSDIPAHWMLIRPAYVGKNSFELQNDSAQDVGPDAGHVIVAIEYCPTPS
jgi:hypothetical protein